MKIATLKISGKDNASFLQGLLTCDINDTKESPILAASCNQKGRIIANFFITHYENCFYLSLPEIMTDILQAHLKKYVFRSDVQFEISATPPNSSRSDINVIWIVPETSEQFTPQMLDLEKHGGVSFTKGCFLGQEIIARTQHLGQLKRHLYHITLETPETVEVGDKLCNLKKENLGTIVDVRDNEIFAVIEDRAIEHELFLNDTAIKNIQRS